MVLAVAVGVVVGLAAAALIGAIERVSELVGLLGDGLGSTRTAGLIAIPVGLLGAWWVARRFAPEVSGDGVPEAAAALALRSGHLPTRSAPLKIIVTALTLGSGGSAGREGPIVQIGSSIGSSIARHTGLGEDRIRSLVAAGAGAAIGASFNAPIAGMLFAMEVILGNFAIRHLNAVVVASVAAAVTTRSIVGQEQILRAVPHRVTDARELVLYVLLALVAVAAAWALLRLLDLTERARLGGPAWIRPVAAGLGVAVIGWVEPDVLGTGQEVTAGLINLIASGGIAWTTLLVLATWKVLATGITMGSGASGGAFMPSLFIGAALGAGFADLFEGPWFGDLAPGAFAIVGMAAMFAAVARAPLTAILIVFEITGDYGLVLPLMLAASLATLLGERVHPESVYTMALSRRGIRLVRRGEVDVLDTVTVGDVSDGGFTAVADPAMSTAEVQGVLDRYHQHGVPVVADGKLVGIITITDIIRSGGPSDGVSAGDAMTPHPVTATPSTPVSVVLTRMASLGVGRVPVVAEDDPGRLVGLFRREDAVRAYHLALGQEIDHEVGREQLRSKVDPGAAFFTVDVSAGSLAAGRQLAELPIPGGVTVVSVRRGLEVMVPEGRTRLQADDVMTVFAPHELREVFVERISVGGEPTEERPVATARFFDLEVPEGSTSAGRPLREMAVPGGCTVVSVRRGLDVIVPDGNTAIAEGDVLTVFARQASRDQFVARLHVRSDDAPSAGE